MPFSSLSDPVVIARAHGALDRAWAKIKTLDGHLLGSEASERLRLAVIISGYASTALDEGDLVDRAVERFMAEPNRAPDPKPRSPVGV